MKLLSTLSTLLLIVAGGQAHAQITQEAAVRSYIDKAYSLYTQSVQGARQTQADIEAFLQNPTEENLNKARTTWTEARKIYSQTEIYRFYGSPIDNESGPEGLINAWPLDEVYIDTIVERVDLYPSLDAATLRELNEKDGEKNISTGWHAIEYMLWGQDLSATGPGTRPSTDYAAGNPLAARRAEYLRTIASALVSDLESVQVQWDINLQDSYAQKFAVAKDSLVNMLIGITKMSGAELSQERMFVALDTHAQEEEHSCFSDTTHFDILYNFVGIKTVLNDGVLEMIRAKDAGVATEIEESLALTENAILAMPIPFDVAIAAGNDEGNAKVFEAIAALETLTEAIRQGAVTIGVEIP